MSRKLFYLLVIVAGSFEKATAQTLTPVQYIEIYKGLAIKEMKRMGVPAAITLAQGLLETESGNSDLVKKSNNHFGIKCKGTWTAETVYHDDDAAGECFRSYKDAEASYRDHSNYLRGTDRYAFLFALQQTDYKGWAKGLRKAGYATNPQYPEILIRNIEQYNLEQYTIEGMKEGENTVTAYKNKVENGVSATNGQEKNILPSNDAHKRNSSEANESSGFINGSKYVIAKKGTSLLAIASENDIDLSKLLSYNDMEDDGILNSDHVIFLQKKSKTGKTGFYMVQQQESLYGVSQKNGIQLKYLLKYNDLTENSLVAAGTQLKLNPVALKQPVAKENGKSLVISASPATLDKIHEVQPKEGLYSIAKNYQVSVQQLREWNNLVNDTLKVGQQLIVSE